MKGTRWILIAAAAVVVVGAAWTWRARAARQAPKFRTAVVERGDIESSVAATGTVQPVEQVEVGSQVSGTVYRMHADYNSRVVEGQVLCELEPSGLNARVAQNEAAVARAEAALEDGRRQLRRAQELSVQQLVPQAELEAAEVTVLQREADLKAARAQLAATRVDQRNAIIRAPISGVVISRNIDLGQTVAASLQAPKLFVIARDLTQMQVETRIDEADIGAVAPGLPVQFTVDAFPDDRFDGEVQVVRLEPIVEQGVVTYTTVIRTRNPDLKLRPGMTANVTVRLARHEDVLKVPAAALRFRPPETRKRGADAAPGGAAAAAQPRPAAARPGAGDGREGGLREGGMRERGPRPGGEAGEGARARRGDGAPAPVGAVVVPGGGGELPAPKPGVVHVLRDGKPVRVQVTTGITDGTSVEVLGGGLASGDVVLTGLEVAAGGARAMTPPPGMGGPMMGGPRGARSGGR